MHPEGYPRYSHPPLIDKYDYSLVNYEKSNQHILIVCSRHGVFQQTPTYHLNGGVCPYCARNRLTREEFMKEVKKHNGEAYDYSRCNYTHKTRKSDYIIITCKKHGDFRQRLDSHLRGSGCSLCRMEYRSKKKVAVVRSRFSYPNLIKRTDGNTCTISMTYLHGESPIKLSSGLFKSKSEANQHIEDWKMFVDMTGSKLGTCKITKSES